MASLIRTFATIRSTIRVRCEHENGTFVTDENLLSMINEAYAELFELVHDSAGPEGIMAYGDAVTVANQQAYDLTSVFTPGGANADQADAYRVIGVDVEFSGTFKPLPNLRWTKRRKMEDQTGWSGPEDTFYRVSSHSRLTGAPEISFYPAPPSAGVNFRVWYLPTAPGDGHGRDDSDRHPERLGCLHHRGRVRDGHREGAERSLAVHRAPRRGRAPGSLGRREPR